jgi:hypothetical protein
MAVESSAIVAPPTPPRIERPAPKGPARSAPSIADLILLAGSVRSELAEATGRSRLDLPLDGSQTLLNHWQRQVTQWGGLQGSSSGAVRVLVQPSSPFPASMAESAGVMPRMERDLRECRGTGGLLRDLADDYEDDQWLLVATAAQVLMEPLDSLVSCLGRIDGDVRLLAHADGTPVGLMLVRCGCLRGLEPIGFIDFKEQGLPRLARSHQVGFALRKQPTGLPVRTHRDYLRAVRWHHLRQACPAVLLDPFAEDWRSAFHVIEAGAFVEPSARLHDAMVLRGGRIERGATVVRSIVCPGAVVPRGQVVIDQMVRPR